MPEIDLGYVLGPKGDPGEPGRDGTDGTPGAPGTPGADGKSAYQYAKEGGFVGTEEQFYTALAEVILKMDKVIPQKVDTIATLSAAGQVQDSGKTLSDYYTKGETVAKGNVYTKSEVYSKVEADGKFAGTDAFYTKAQTMTTATGQLFGTGITTPNAAFQAIKTLINNNQAQIDKNVDIVTGSYVGNGQYGEGSPNSITFKNQPIFVVVIRKDNSNLYDDIVMIWVQGVIGPQNRHGNIKSFSQTSNTLKWWSYSDASYQLNASGITYCYAAAIKKGG